MRRSAVVALTGGADNPQVRSTTLLQLLLLSFRFVDVGKNTRKSALT